MSGHAAVWASSDPDVASVDSSGVVIALAAGSADISAKVDDVIPVGQTIAWLVKPGEAPPASAGPTQTGRKMDAPAAMTTGAAPAPAAAPAPGARISPRARGLAREHGVDLSTINGSGPGGEIHPTGPSVSPARKAPITLRG